MRIQSRQFIGMALGIAVILFVIAYQTWGPGLIWTDQPSLPPEAVAKGIWNAERTNYHLALFPLLIVGGIGFALALFPSPKPAKA
jgi:hypothetical protein